MDNINKKIAIVVLGIGIILGALVLFTSLTDHIWFSAVIGLWLFVFCSCCYRLTPAFKKRNTLDNFIQRDAQHLMLFSLAGFFDKKFGPQWLVIGNIEHIESKNDELIIHSNNERQFSVSLPAQKNDIDAYMKRILSDQEKQTIRFS
ncbi:MULTISPECIES: hypothetical protein [Pseudoalteromonas]|jgi:hypothetical protein|uniref:hypothetical protein n=1 Tax=Pseudoalteromonas TaxID=53246 RepID=UPI0002CB4685|nr:MULTISPECIES: hypothetical protein [Pseudoalteromonas]MCP4056522.1 hypothetical protein [Pseudoalteromonas sp.]ENN97716.1 hypothetical protein J139_16182 [Pseudoalteromonas agarivorans S816]MCK8106118.1 hypothetical protein [Pseudoalteromonas sp. 2CM41L]MCW1718907.1 hypothetical protein [Pseudoalteromonas sp. A3]MDI3246435.1 hypothetical protein [Pseudoalteromonas agarivorans]